MEVLLAEMASEPGVVVDFLFQNYPSFFGDIHDAAAAAASFVDADFPGATMDGRAASLAARGVTRGDLGHLSISE